MQARIGSHPMWDLWPADRGTNQLIAELIFQLRCGAGQVKQSRLCLDRLWRVPPDIAAYLGVLLSKFSKIRLIFAELR